MISQAPTGKMDYNKFVFLAALEVFPVPVMVMNRWAIRLYCLLRISKFQEKMMTSDIVQRNVYVFFQLFSF